MNELVKKKETKPGLPGMPEMPMLPEILQSAMPVAIPPMEYEDGLINNFFGNWKRKQIAKSKEFEAQIAEAAYREVRARLDTMHAVITFSARLKDTFEEYQYKSESRKVRLETEKAELIQQQLKNMLLQSEAKLSELELKIKLKDLEDLLRGTPED